MSNAEDARLVVDAVAVLHRSGESTDITVRAVTQLNRALRTTLDVVPSWASVTVVDRDTAHPVMRPAAATGIQMNAVAVLMRAVDEMSAGAAGRDEVRAAVDAARGARPAPTALFILACATASSALAVIFGADDPTSVVLAGVSAAVGGGVRRLLAAARVGVIGQVFAAALIAGLIGGAAVNADLSSSLRLIAVCPAMVLVPGPHILNGALDLLSLRVALGSARLAYAAVLLTAIGGGLAVGLALFGTGLPPTPPVREVALPIDVLAAAVAAASYPIYFAMPYRLMWWPVVVGAVAHGLRWAAMSLWGWDIVAGALLACLFVGAALAPVARARHIPFAGIGFAAVVSLVPGVFVFRAVDVLSALPFTAENHAVLMGAAVDGITAVLVVIAMAVGLAVPMHVVNAGAPLPRHR